MGPEAATAREERTLKGLLYVVLGIVKCGSGFGLWCPFPLRTLATPTLPPLQTAGRDQPTPDSSALSLILSKVKETPTSSPGG